MPLLLGAVRLPHGPKIDMPDCKSDIVLGHYRYGRAWCIAIQGLRGQRNAATSSPFALWPDGIEGSSVQLGQAMDQFNEHGQNEYHEGN
ncbi:hypothetical protein JQR88_23560 (plasmid) [Pseudomonas luteola]|uniref:hypothetical protein n=1 Tax=Pseudomonas luteola TaxID=47886 RepID=UPI003DA06539